MGTAVGVLTCKRDGVDYLPATLAALEAAGAADAAARFVIVDGTEPVAAPGWDVLPGVGRQGHAPSMWRAFAHALAIGADRLIFCEDDIIACTNAVRYMAALEIPSSVAFVDFHDIEEMRFATTPGLYNTPPMGWRGSGFYGTQCLMLPNRTLRMLVRKNPLDVFPRNQGDTALGYFVGKSLMPYYAVHLPRLVRHVGVTSAAHPTRPPLVTLNYPGDDFDALSLGAPGLRTISL